MPKNHKSRWGKLNSGQVFHIVAADIDRALSFAMLSGYEVALMEQIRERCWGEPSRAKRGRGEPWPDAVSCRINLSQLEKETGIPRQRFSRAKANLIRSRILIEDGEEISINKSADQWVFPESGEPRLSPKLLEFCDSARPKTQAEFEVMSEQENSEHFLSQGEHFLSQGVNGKVFTPRTLFESGGERKSVHPPIEDRARGIRQERLNTDSIQTGGRGRGNGSIRPTKAEQNAANHARLASNVRSMFRPEEDADGQG